MRRRPGRATATVLVTQPFLIAEMVNRLQRPDVVAARSPRVANAS